MKYLVINPKRITTAQSTLIVDYLNQGKVVVYPTDTIYGFGCLADKAQAIKRIRKIKGSDTQKPLLVLMKDLGQVKKYCVSDSEKTKIIKELNLIKNVRPTSYILPHKNKLPAVLTGSSLGLGFRLPKSNFLRKILSMVEAPLVSTSLNLSGQTVLSTPGAEVAKFKVDLVIDAGILKNRASRLIDLSGAKARVIRK